MNKVKLWIAVLLSSITLTLSACGQSTTAAAPGNPERQQSPDVILPSGTQSQQISFSQESSFSLSAITPYAGSPYISVNDNIPYFEEEELVTQSYETYSELDDLGRCQTAYACIGIDLMPTEERDNIGQIKPTGWHLAKYDTVEGRYLYNRCHLIGYQLTGENANEKNLMTGTRYLNVQGMLPFENTVADYVRESENHVLYRVTPIFEGNNLLASGVLMEAESVEDKGESILFCVYVYNVQPGITIDYATGESFLDTSAPESVTAAPSESFAAAPSAPGTTAMPAAPSTETLTQPQLPQASEFPETTYILNINTKKFHYPSCSSVEKMKESNKEEYTGDRDTIISQGYVPCKNCNP